MVYTLATGRFPPDHVSQRLERAGARSLTERLVNHARPCDVAEGYATDWTVEQLSDPAQRIADRIDELMEALHATNGLTVW